MELKQVGPWEVERKLGAGGMGTVYLGKHKVTGSQAAVKVLPASLAREEGFVERFQREIDSMQKLKSPHIVEFYESGHDGDVYFYAMEYVDGDTLTSRLRSDKRIPWPEVIDLTAQICRALKAAHNAGIVHRDLKPSNLMISSDGTVKLADFGVAQVFASAKLTVTGGIVGTAEYMSPEQAKGQRATKKSDLYSLGAVMYVMLTGRPPFSGKTSLDVIHKHQFAQFDKPSMYAPDIPKLLDEIVCKLLEKEPDKRFPDSYVLSLRLAEVQKRFAWQAAPKPSAAQSSGSSISPTGESTEAGAFARIENDPNAMAPTILIPNAIGGHVPMGPTISAPSGQAAPFVMGATLTASSIPPDQSLDATRQIVSLEGPGTLMRNLMRKVISDQRMGGPISQTFDNTWVQVISLLVIVAASVWMFRNWGMTDETRFDRALAIMEKQDKTAEDWGSAKEHFEALRKSNADRWQEVVAPHLQKISLYEAKMKLRGNRHGKGSLTASEPKRILQLAQEYLLLGDAGHAENKLLALLALTEGQKDFAEVHASARNMLQLLRDDRSERTPEAWLVSALSRAEKHVSTQEIGQAQAIWQAIIELYGDDPEAVAQVRQAQEGLSRSASNSSKDSSQHTPLPTP